MKLSAKCRSGRDLVRVVGHRPSCRGGKTSCSLCNDKSVAGKDDGDVMVPAGKAATLVVIESELAFEIFVDAFGSPALHYKAYELRRRHRSRQRAKEVVSWFGFTIPPLDQEPHRFAIRDLDMWVGPAGPHDSS